MVHRRYNGTCFQRLPRPRRSAAASPRRCPPQPSAPPMLEAIDLAARRGSSHLFSSLSFSVESGCAMFVTGANGTGKTTLLRILAGLGTPFAGTVRWRGVDVAPFAQGLRDDVAYGGSPAGIEGRTHRGGKSCGAGRADRRNRVRHPSCATRSRASPWNARHGFRRARSPRGSAGAWAWRACRSPAGRCGCSTSRRPRSTARESRC